MRAVLFLFLLLLINSFHIIVRPKPFCDPADFLNDVNLFFQFIRNAFDAFPPFRHYKFEGKQIQIH